MTTKRYKIEVESNLKVVSMAGFHKSFGKSHLTNNCTIKTTSRDLCFFVLNHSSFYGLAVLKDTPI